MELKVCSTSRGNHKLFSSNWMIGYKNCHRYSFECFKYSLN